jgi:hypothetical protein
MVSAGSSWLINNLLILVREFDFSWSQSMVLVSQQHLVHYKSKHSRLGERKRMKPTVEIKAL